MRKILAALLACFLLAFGVVGFAACSDPETPPEDTRPVLLVLGDSGWAGANSSAIVDQGSGKWPASSPGAAAIIAGECAGYRTVMNAIGGHDTAALLQLIRTNEECRANIGAADVISISIIGNDVLTNPNNMAIMGGDLSSLPVILSKAKLNMLDILYEIGELNDDAVLVVNEMNGHWGEYDEQIDGGLNSVFEDILKEDPNAFIILPMEDLPEGCMDTGADADPVHPNDKGHVYNSIQCYRCMRANDLLLVDDAQYVENFGSYLVSLLETFEDVKGKTVNIDAYRAAVENAATVEDVYAAYVAAYDGAENV